MYFRFTSNNFTRESWSPWKEHSLKTSKDIDCLEYFDNYFTLLFFTEGSKEHAILVAYTSAGMLYELIKACEKNKLSSCRYKDIYHCRSNTCYTLDPLVPLRLIKTFFDSSTMAKTKYQKLLNQHNREIGWEVSIYSVSYTHLTLPTKA